MDVNFPVDQCLEKVFDYLMILMFDAEIADGN